MFCFPPPPHGSARRRTRFICYLLFNGFFLKNFNARDMNIFVFAIYHFVVIYKLIEQNTLIKNGKKYAIDDDSDLI